MSKVKGGGGAHSAPWDCVLSKDEKGECRAGPRPASDREYFEILCLCLIQAGLNWASIRKHWPRYREGFHGFRLERLSRADADELLARPGVIKNRRKVEAVLHNAREFEAIAAEHGSFGAFLSALEPLPEAERVKALTRRFKQVGPETADYFLHSIGFEAEARP
ncbi:MAG TPA: DNA-3-methyladenine glycosylase I [Pyrinomonadaceae bacterium]|jgi:DNA-3-methyladenine glycosylase I